MVYSLPVFVVYSLLNYFCGVQFTNLFLWRTVVQNCSHWRCSTNRLPSRPVSRPCRYSPSLSIYTCSCIVYFSTVEPFFVRFFGFPLLLFFSVICQKWINNLAIFRETDTNIFQRIKVYQKQRLPKNLVKLLFHVYLLTTKCPSCQFSHFKICDHFFIIWPRSSDD